jgi:hypothetical protein
MTSQILFRSSERCSALVKTKQRSFERQREWQTSAQPEMTLFESLLKKRGARKVIASAAIFKGAAA